MRGPSGVSRIQLPMRSAYRQSHHLQSQRQASASSQQRSEQWHRQTFKRSRMAFW